VTNQKWMMRVIERRRDKTWPSSVKGRGLTNTREARSETEGTSGGQFPAPDGLEGSAGNCKTQAWQRNKFIQQRGLRKIEEPHTCGYGLTKRSIPKQRTDERTSAKEKEGLKERETGIEPESLALGMYRATRKRRQKTRGFLAKQRNQTNYSTQGTGLFRERPGRATPGPPRVRPTEGRKHQHGEQMLSQRQANPCRLWRKTKHREKTRATLGKGRLHKVNSEKSTLKSQAIP